MIELETDELTFALTTYGTLEVLIYDSFLDK